MVAFYLVLEHGSDKHRAQTLQHLLDGLLDFATSEQGAKSVTKALKEGGKPTLDRIVERMCEAATGWVPSLLIPICSYLADAKTRPQVPASHDSRPRAERDRKSADRKRVAHGTLVVPAQSFLCARH